MIRRTPVPLTFEAHCQRLLVCLLQTSQLKNDLTSLPSLVSLQDDTVACSLLGDKILFYSDNHLVRQYLESYYLNVSGRGHGMLSPTARSALLAASSGGGSGQDR